ncbi:hypothetical protein ACXYTJ_00370 [Gilvimarinus sp. F26214L]|uniref:hypothetical protein n=1 Tax=Gilvimarinus sp. DZF01 TaxID=3461371 RepID=UPI00404626B5
MYFKLTSDVLVKHGIHEPLGLPWDLNFMQGSVIQEPVDNPFIFRTKAEVGDKVPDFSDGGFPAMSGRFVKILEGAGVDNLEKFPALVKSEVDDMVWDGYYLVNILGIIKCADLERSTYTETFPGNFNFKELAIDAERQRMPCSSDYRKAQARFSFIKVSASI